MKSTRSTVGTITEINDYLKLLFPRVVARALPGVPARDPPRDGEVDRRAGLRRSTPARRCSSPSACRCRPKTEPAEFFAFLQQQGYLRVVARRRRSIASTSRRRSSACPPSCRSSRIASRSTRRKPLAPHRGRRDRAAFRQRQGRLHPAAARPRQPLRSAPAGTARIATSTSRRRRRGCSASTIRSARVRRCRGFGRTIAIDLRARDSRPRG